MVIGLWVNEGTRQSLHSLFIMVLSGRFTKFKSGFPSKHEVKTQKHKTAGDLQVLLPKIYNIMSVDVLKNTLGRKTP